LAYKQNEDSKITKWDKYVKALMFSRQQRKHILQIYITLVEFCHNVLDFIKETHFYSKLWCLQTFLY